MILAAGGEKNKRWQRAGAWMLPALIILLTGCEGEGVRAYTGADLFIAGLGLFVAGLAVGGILTLLWRRPHPDTLADVQARAKLATRRGGEALQ